MKRSFSRALAIAVAVSALAAVSGCGKLGSALKYESTPATRGDIVQYVTASGTLSAVVSVDVGSQVSGKIATLYADFNSPVKKGQLVAEIDPTVYDATMRQAEGQLATSKAEVLLKRQNLARMKTLTPLHAASQSDLDLAIAQLDEADADVVIKQAALDSARANLNYCKITAPVDGMVISRKVDVGQTVIAAMTTPVLFTIAQDITKMNISATVSEADIGQVHDRQSVNFTVDAFPDEIFHGKVEQVRESPTTTQNVVTYETIIAVDNPERKLFPGMTADVSIFVAERKGALKIPNAALRYTPPDNAEFEERPPAKLDRSQRLVYAQGSNASKLKPAIIRAGITDGVDTEVVDGLAEGAPVVTSTDLPDAFGNGFGGSGR